MSSTTDGYDYEDSGLDLMYQEQERSRRNSQGNSHTPRALHRRVREAPPPEHLYAQLLLITEDLASLKAEVFRLKAALASKQEKEASPDDGCGCH